MNFSFTVTTSPKYLCLGDSVRLTCTAQVSARWRSDDIFGPDQTITFLILNQINSTKTVGNGTSVLLETSPRIVTSLSFNLTADRVETSCTDGQTRTTTRTSSVQPSEFQSYIIFVVANMLVMGVCVCKYVHALDLNLPTPYPLILSLPADSLSSPPADSLSSNIISSC